jgi:hypothetical protein
MKTQKFVIGFLLVLLVQLAACERNDIDIPAKALSSDLNEINISGPTSILQGEAIVFKLNNDLSANKFKWVVSPNKNVLVTKNDSIASIYFPESGKYTVTVMDSIKLDSVTIKVNVNVEGRYPNEVVSQQDFKSDDFLKLTPVIYKDSAFIILEAETRNVYPCSDNYLASTIAYNEESFQVNFSGVNFPSGCKSESSKSKREFLLRVKEDKTYTLEINFKNKVYKGTVTKNGNDYKFTWPYTGDVTVDLPVFMGNL